MTTSQRRALAIAFERLQQRITAQPEAPAHPIIEKRNRVIARARRGSYRRRMSHIEE